MKDFKQQEDFKGIFLVTLWRLDSNGARVKGMELLELWILPRRAGCVLVVRFKERQRERRDQVGQRG